MPHTTPTTVLLATTLQPLVAQLSGALAPGAKRLAPFLAHEPTPQPRMTFEQELRGLGREGGRRMVAGLWHHVEPAGPKEAPVRVGWQGQPYRRRRQQRPTMATLLGPGVVWRRLEEPLTPGRPALHPLALTWGMEAGVAPPALAARVGRGAAAPTPRQGLEVGPEEHGVHGSCATLRKLLSKLSAGLATHRQAAQIAQGVRWLHQARTATGRFQPLWAVGRDGVHVPLRPRQGQEGADGDRLGLESPWPASRHRILRPEARGRADDLDRAIARPAPRQLESSR